MRFVSMAASESVDPFFPHFAEQTKQDLSEREKKRTDGWQRNNSLEMLRSYPLLPACCQGFSPIPWMHAVKTPISPKYHTWVQVVKKLGFIYWISNRQVPHSCCCLDVKDLLRGPTGINVTGNSRGITHRVWLYFSSFSHITLEMASAWQDQLVLWRKVKAKYSLFFCFISFALSGNSLLLVFILKSDNISQIPSHQRAATYTLWNVFPGMAEILSPSRNAQHFLATDSNTTKFLQCPWMCFGYLKFKGTAVKWDDNCADSVLKEN